MKTLFALLLLTIGLSALAETTNVIYANPLTNQNSTCPCKFSRIQVASYIKPAPAWGWKASNAAPCQVIIANPGTNKICVEAGNQIGAVWKGTNSLTFTPGTAYAVRFSLYFKYSVPTNAYPITIVNFNP